MVPLQPSDAHRICAAVGWLELGNPAEAGEEIARVSPGCLEHPAVLEVRWSVCAAERRWEAALEIAELLARHNPDQPAGWIHRAYALRRIPQGGIPLAYAALRPLIDKFPEEPTIPFNLACYVCQMGRLEEALEWLRKAAKAAGGSKVIKAMALADPDLAPLGERLDEF